MIFHINVDSQEIAKALEADLEQTRNLLKEEVKTLAIRAHAFIADKARKELHGFMYEYYMGRSEKSGSLGSNLQIHHISDSTHVITLAEKASWIEEGRDRTWMGDWLLNSPKAKTAKDGSKYLVIPMKIAHLAGPGGGKAPQVPALETMAKAAISQLKPKVHSKKIEFHADGRPKEGRIHKLDINDPGREFAGFHSKPRSKEMAAMTGLPAHEGIFYGQGAGIHQKAHKNKAGEIIKTKTGKPKVSRDVMTFRVISSKHKAEGRWMYPEVKPFGGFKAAEEWAREAAKCRHRPIGGCAWDACRVYWGVTLNLIGVRTLTWGW